MHPQAYFWVRSVVAAQGPFDSVVEVGSRCVNGSVRSCFYRVRPPYKDDPYAKFDPVFPERQTNRYVGVDMRPGDGTDLEVDWLSQEDWALVLGFNPACVVSCEVLEHCREAQRAVELMVDALAPGGVLILTCAAPPRKVHGNTLDGPEPGEHYRNIMEHELRGWLKNLDEWVVDYRMNAGDLHAWARKKA